MLTRTLSPDDRLALEDLLRREPAHNVFHLSALREQGMMGVGHADGAWAVGAYDLRDQGPGVGDQGTISQGSPAPDSRFLTPGPRPLAPDPWLSGAVVASRGTGGLYHSPGDSETLQALAQVVRDKARSGLLSLLSGHASQVDPLLSLLPGIEIGPIDRCHFRMLECGMRNAEFGVRVPTAVDDAERISSYSTFHVPHSAFRTPRLATSADMEHLIDFYEIGFYSLARLPTRAAWRYRLSEQIAYRTMFLIEDADGKVVSAAQSSAEAYGAAMLGGVATLPEHRGKGLSTLCVGALCDYLFNKGTQTISLFYLKGNQSASRVYQKLGFQEAGEWLLVSLGIMSTQYRVPSTE